jgi:imidazolonepropionase-like amidohydrolase
MIKEKGIFLVPTVGVIDVSMAKSSGEPVSPARRQRMDQFLLGIQQEIQVAMSLGIKIASGFDASEAAVPGRNAQELAALVKRGMSPADAIRAAELLGWQDRVGSVEAGKFADIIAFVMKGGTEIKPYLGAGSTGSRR